MISGYLLLNPNKNVDIPKIKKYIFKILCFIVLFGYGYLLMELLFTKKLNLLGLYKLIIDVLEGNVWAHLWYLYMLVGLYIITPLLRYFIKNANKETIKFTMLSLFIVAIIIPTFNEIFNMHISEFYLESFKYIFIYMLGYFLGQTDIIKDKVVYICGIVGIIGYFILLYFLGNDSQTNMFVLFESVLIFRLMSSGKLKIKDNKLINLISKYSLGIYLVHQFYLNLLYKVLNIFPDILPIFVGEMFILILVLILSLLTSAIMYRLPIIKKLYT